MPRITIDQNELEVPSDVTILEAAEQAGVDIPTLCHFKGFGPSTSCLVCMVKVVNTGRIVPACATQVEDGMLIESETDEVHQIRKTALELLLSDHVGDCRAPCHFTCPAHMDVPLMLRQVAAKKVRDAIITVKTHIALPAVLGRICPKPCEKGCRRRAADGPVAICDLKRYVADQDLASEEPFMPNCKSPTGKRVAIVGAGPTGLAASYYLRQAGHGVVLFDELSEPGGRLRHEPSEDDLPRDVLDAEIDMILRLGVEFHANTRVDDNPSLDDLRSEYDALLIACGAIDLDLIERWGLGTNARGIRVSSGAYATDINGVFAAGNAIRKTGLVVRSVADGKEAAESIDRFLSSGRVSSGVKTFSVRMKKVHEGELRVFLATADRQPRHNATDTEEAAAEAIRQAERCLHCDCRAAGTCRLERYATMYGADPNRFRSTRPEFRQYAQHATVIYEPGKCIDCGLCIEIAARGGEPLGLTFIGRGFDVRMGVPFERTLQEALGKMAAECVAACPTAALAMKEGSSDGSVNV